MSKKKHSTKENTVKKLKKGRAGYLIVTSAINQELKTYGNVPGMSDKQYRLVSTFDEAKHIVMTEAQSLKTADSTFAIQDITEEFKDFNSNLKFHGIAHVYFNNDLKPIVEADDPNADPIGWYSVMFDIYEVRVEK